MPDASMRLLVLQPFDVFVDLGGVSRVVAQTPQGSVGFWPHRLDCAATLVQGILAYQRVASEEVFVAVDAGVLVKTGAFIRVSVRRAVGGTDLARLRDTVAREFEHFDDAQQRARSAMGRVEADLMRRFASLRDG